jgi:hypothetical protein
MHHRSTKEQGKGQTDKPVSKGRLRRLHRLSFREIDIVPIRGGGMIGSGKKHEGQGKYTKNQPHDKPKFFVRSPFLGDVVKEKGKKKGGQNGTGDTHFRTSCFWAIILVKIAFNFPKIQVKGSENSRGRGSKS